MKNKIILGLFFSCLFLNSKSFFDDEFFGKKKIDPRRSKIISINREKNPELFEKQLKVMNLIREDSLDKLEAFLKSEQINLNFSIWGDPAIFFTHNIETIKLLIKYGADIDIPNRDNSSILIEAARRNDKELVKFLIEAGADLNIKAGSHRSNEDIGYTALHVATHNNYNELAILLIKSGINLTIKDNQGKRALSDENIEFYKSKRNIILKAKILLFAVIELGDTNTVKDIIKLITLNLHDKDGNNALHLAAIHNKSEIFKLILSVRPDLINKSNKFGKTPIEINPALGNYEFIKNILGIKIENKSSSSRLINALKKLSLKIHNN